MKYALYALLTLVLHFPFDCPLALLPFIPDGEAGEVVYVWYGLPSLDYCCTHVYLHFFKVDIQVHNLTDEYR